MLIGKHLLNFSLAICIMLTACHRLERKTSDIKEKVEHKVNQEMADAVDHLIARFDPDEADSRFNKKRFEEMFGFAPTTDVKEIYGRSDNMGVDHTYWLSFQCQDSTVKKISARLNLSPDKSWDSQLGAPFYTQETDPWWDSTFTLHHAPLSNTSNNTHNHLWYDPKRRKVYFATYDM